MFLSFDLRETKTKMKIPIFYLRFVSFIFIHSLDNQKLFRFMSIAGESAGNSLIKTLQALFCHVILGD